MIGLAIQDRLTLPEVDAEKARRYLRDYVRQAWHVVEPTTPFVPGWHIDAICEHLEAATRGQIRKLLINVPPRHSKSLAISVFWPTWVWATFPEVRWLFASYALPLAIRDSLKCRRIIDSPWYQARWGEVFSLTGDMNLKSRFENDKTGYRLCGSVDSAITGEGASVLVVDDPHNIIEAQSDSILEKTITWWDQAMSTRLDDPKTGIKVIMAQRVHENDLCGHLLREGGWDTLILPGEYEPKRMTVTSIGWRDPRVLEGELLWPNRFGREEMKSLRLSLGEYGYAGQVQQRPSPLEGGLIKRAWWRYYKEMPPLSEFSEMLQSWDMAYKRTTDSDYVVGQVWGRKGADRYLLDQDRGRRNFPETVQAVLRMTRKWPGTHAKLVEDKANGPAVISTLCHMVPGMIAVNPQGGKRSRMAAVSPQIEAGNVWLPHPSIAPWVDGFVEELSSFPNGAHDDQADACSQGLVRMEAPWEIVDMNVKIE